MDFDVLMMCISNAKTLSQYLRCLVYPMSMGINFAALQLVSCDFFTFNAQGWYATNGLLGRRISLFPNLRACSEVAEGQVQVHGAASPPSFSLYSLHSSMFLHAWIMLPALFFHQLAGKDF
jgi:hypothetical protein